MVSSGKGDNPRERRGTMNYEVRQSNENGAFLIAYQGTKPVYLHRYNDVNDGGLMRDVIAIRENGDTSTWVCNEPTPVATS